MGTLTESVCWKETGQAVRASACDQLAATVGKQIGSCSTAYDSRGTAQQLCRWHARTAARGCAVTSSEHTLTARVMLS